MDLARPITAELTGIHSLRGDRHRTGRDQAQRVRVGQVRGIDRRRQDIDTDLHRRGGTAALVEGDGDVRAVEVWHNVGAHRVNGGRGLQPHRLRQSTVVPPVGEAPGNNVLARAPGRIIDTDRDGIDVAGHDRVRGVECERRRATLMVAKVVAIEPDIGDVVGRAELQRDRLVLPVRGDIEVLSVPGAVAR